MLLTLAILCFFQALGEWVSVLSGLPIPGPVLGMVFLFITLLLKPGLNHHIAAASEQLLKSMMVMFIPVCVGIMTSYTLLKGQWLALVAVLSVVLVAALLGAEDVLIISLAPKSATMPIAMGVSEKLGGLASLAAVGVMGTGIFGVMTARYIFKVIRIESPEIRGFMLGLTAHGIGVARGFQISNEIGTFAGLGMSLNGLLTAFLVPLVVTLHFVLF